jgi:flagellar biosynthesis/type III secretory pathway protein FliH
MARAHLRGE